MSNRSRKAIVEFPNASSSSSSSIAQSGGRRRRNQSISNQSETIPEEERVGQSNDGTGDIDTNSTEFKLVTNNCVRYILMHEHTKQYVKQSDINHFLQDHHTLGRDYINEVMTSVAQQLFKEFGLCLIEVPNVLGIMFILHTIYTKDLIHPDEIDSKDNEENDDFDNDLNDILNNTPSDYEDLAPNNDDINLNDLSFNQVLDTSKSTLLLIVLSFILLEETQSLSEDELFRNLKEIGLSLETKIENFHDSSKMTIKELISKEFVRQYYLKRTKVSNLDANAPAQHNYEWAFRAEIEFQKTDVLNFVKSIYDGNQAYLNQLETKCQASDLKRAEMINGGNQETQDEPIFLEPVVTMVESQSTLTGGGTRSGTQNSSGNSAPRNSTPRRSTRNSGASHVEALADNSIFGLSQIDPASTNQPSSSNESTNRKPGRPRKIVSKTAVSTGNQKPMCAEKKGRGRPRNG